MELDFDGLKTCFFLFRVRRVIKLAFLSLKGEWEDNKESLLEFIWAAHWGVKGEVSLVFKPLFLFPN